MLFCLSGECSCTYFLIIKLLILLFMCVSIFVIVLASIYNTVQKELHVYDISRLRQLILNHSKSENSGRCSVYRHNRFCSIVRSGNRNRTKTVLRNIAEMTGGDETKAASRSVLCYQVNYIVYMLLIRINFYVS
jgi:hypothetical protein